MQFGTAPCPKAAHKWSYTEWQNQLDRLTEEEVARIQSGTPLDWFEESNAICREIYVATPEGSDLPTTTSLSMPR